MTFSAIASGVLFCASALKNQQTEQHQREVRVTYHYNDTAQLHATHFTSNVF
jgi:hypothetical protein